MDAKSPSFISYIDIVRRNDLAREGHAFILLCPLTVQLYPTQLPKTKKKDS